MLTARNEAELRSMLSLPMRVAVEYVVEQIWQENRELIQRLIYDVYSPTMYNRSMGFLDAWDFESAASGAHSLASGKFHYAPERMSVGNAENKSSPSYAQHIGVAGDYKGVDSREYLAEILYGARHWGSAFGSGAFTRQRNVYQELVKRIGKGKLLRWFERGMKSQGFRYTRNTSALQVTEND